MKRSLILTTLSLALFALCGHDAAAQCPGGQCARQSPGVRYYTPTYRMVQTPAGYYAPAAPAVRQAEPALASASYDPLYAVNAQRAARGLRPLALDGNLSAWARLNNASQAGRGLGHHVTCGAAQCAAGVGDPASAAAMWASSPAHAAIMLNPAATVAGIDHSGRWATLNVR